MSVESYLKKILNEEVSDFNKKIEALRNKMQTDVIDYYKKEYGDKHPDLSNDNSKVTVKPGKKYTKIDVGHSGKLMINNETGDIHGIKGYGVPNLIAKHHYGTLDTIDDYYWGEYNPKKK